jgi:hypothetical protein
VPSKGSSQDSVHKSSKSEVTPSTASASEQTEFDDPILNDEIDALDQLFLSSQRLLQSAEYRDFLKFISRFSKYSPFNAALLHVQNPGDRFVATPRQWLRDFKRHVEPDARPYVILQPFGPVLLVYDVGDTVPVEGTQDDLPDHVKNPFAVEGSIDQQMWSRVVSNCQGEERIAIRLEKGLHENYAGRIEPAGSKNKPYLKPDRTDCTHIVTVRNGENCPYEEKYATLSHELAHLFCGHLGADGTDWWPDRPDLPIAVREIEAESVAYLVCRRAGLVSRSDWYLRNHLTKIDDDQLLPPIRVRVILDAVNYIEKIGKPDFSSKRDTA